jgi:polysaccharide export outer membrane protein
MYLSNRFRFLTTSLLLGLASMGTFQSCVSTKGLVYFQGTTERFTQDSIQEVYTSTIQPNDLLSIIIGSLSPESDAIFNVPNQYMTSSMSYSATASGGRSQSLGYLVDPDGNIELPLSGKINIQGLKTQVAADTIRQRLLKYLREPTVTIRSLNFKVSVLGEVNRPAVYVIPDERITLPEVLSLAGDLTVYGRRENVTIIREENGVRQYAKINLLTREVFDSPYYYLHKNDVVYVEPVDARATYLDQRIQLAPLVISFLTAVSLILIRF